MKKRVTGVGGIFFKCESPENMRNWYRDHLGFRTNDYGATFDFREADNPEKIGQLQWSPFSAKTQYFAPSQKDFMVNFRVENMEELVAALKEEGVQVLDEIETYDYGKFVHIMDPEGNKIQLWEPTDFVFSDDGGEAEAK